MPATSLRPERIISTLEQLQQRIRERFPRAALVDICGDLLETARAAEERAEALAKPVLWVRAASLVCIVVLVIIIFWAFVSSLPSESHVMNMAWSERMSSFDAGVQQLIAAGIALVFFLSLERRLKRHRALKAIHELRAFAHVIDMHQLTKDPSHFLLTVQKTPSSPLRDLSPAETFRYLDYCSEMLSLIGKIGALYIQNFDDSVTITSASELESLTTGLTQKIWQKIMILEKLEPQGDGLIL